MRFAILRFDAAIAKAAARQITKSTTDLLTILLGLPLLALVARAWLKGLPSELRDLMSYGSSALIATVVAKALLERVWFHRSEGALARVAQRPAERLLYVGPLLVVGLLLGFSGMAAVGILSPGGAVLGAGAGVAGGLAIPFVRERVQRWWRDFTPKSGFDLIRHKHAPIIGAGASVGFGAIGVILPQDGYLVEHRPVSPFAKFYAAAESSHFSEPIRRNRRYVSKAGCVGGLTLQIQSVSADYRLSYC